MVQTLKAIKGGGGSIKVGTTGTISSLISRELNSTKSAQTLPSCRDKSLIPLAVSNGATTSLSNNYTAATVEERLKSFLGQLQTEFGILDRIVYKNKNQHRRSSYFQYLLKVRRDLRLLQSAHLDELLNSSFLVIHGNRPKQKVQLLESLKRRRCDGGKHNFLERLLGVARLLSQMLEPMLKAATEISTVLARSFFMGFSLTVLALLARLRVLVQQILLDVVSVFNMVSSLSQKEQSVKLSQAGIEVFREYYPTNEQAYSLECVWEADKFVLREKINKTGTKNQEQDVSDNGSQGASTIQYQSIEVLLGDNGKMDPNQTSEGLNNMEDTTGSLMDPATGSGNGKKIEDGPHVAEPPSENISPKGGLLTTLSSSQTHSSRLKPVSRNKVAFVSVKKPAPSSANFAGIPISETQNKNSKEDPFFSLLTGGNLKDSFS